MPCAPALHVVRVGGLAGMLILIASCLVLAWHTAFPSEVKYVDDLMLGVEDLWSEWSVEDLKMVPSLIDTVVPPKLGRALWAVLDSTSTCICSQNGRQPSARLCVKVVYLCGGRRLLIGRSSRELEERSKVHILSSRGSRRIAFLLATHLPRRNQTFKF